MLFKVNHPFAFVSVSFFSTPSLSVFFLFSFLPATPPVSVCDSHFLRVFFFWSPFRVTSHVCPPLFAPIIITLCAVTNPILVTARIDHSRKWQSRCQMTGRVTPILLRFPTHAVSRRPEC